MGFFLTNQKMKTESKKLTYIFNGIEFIDLNCLKFAVENKAFRKDTYEYLVNSCLKKNQKSNLLPLTTFKEFLRKYPKKKPCWCLSNSSFIDCHFNKEQEAKLSKNDQFKLIKKNFEYKECLHKNVSPCSDLIIKAHSISRTDSLQSVSKYNHVYGMKIDFNGLNFSKIGTKIASTFTCFCEKHDGLIFSSFEKINFEKTSKQLFDLCYRAICIEYNTMQSVINLFTLSKEHIDNSENILNQIRLQITKNSQIDFYKLGIKYSNYYKTKMENIYKKASYENLLNHYIFELSDEYPKFQSSSCFNLNIDLEGNYLQDLDNPNIQSKNVFLNCITLNGRGYFILSWFVENDSYGQQIIKSIINKPQQIEDKLFTLIFLYIHNTYASPEWYENLTKEQIIQVNALQSFWNETDKFSTDMICSNFDSIKVNEHGYYKNTLSF